MIPQAITDALTKLVGDQGDLITVAADETAKKQAAADAQHAADVAKNATVAANSQFAGDKQALHDLIDATFPTPAPTPSVSPVG